MDDYKSIEIKVWNVISMLTSGVLTSLIYGLLSSSSYSLNIGDRYYEITSVGMNPWHAIGLVGLTFLGIWVIISVLIPRILKIRKRFSYDKIKKITAKEAIKALDDAGNAIKELYPAFNVRNNDYLKLYSRNLARTVLLLHRKLLPQNKRLRNRIRDSYFRNSGYDLIISIDQRISRYELASEIKLLKYMVGQLDLAAGDDALLKEDCREMNEALDELKELTAEPMNRSQKPKVDGL